MLQDVKKSDGVKRLVTHDCIIQGSAQKFYSMTGGNRAGRFRRLNTEKAAVRTEADKKIAAEATDVQHIGFPV